MAAKNRIGQGIEFDYCCVHAAYALKDAEFETVMVNCNPETVSTDYDTSDRLYFEPLTAEDVIALVRREQMNGSVPGCIVQYGGQTPLKLSQALARAQIPILGTSADAIDVAEDRERFQRLLRGLGLHQPENGTARSVAEAEKIAERIGYPVVIRPSYVLGGRAMEIVYDRQNLQRYMRDAVRLLLARPAPRRRRSPSSATCCTRALFRIRRCQLSSSGRSSQARLSLGGCPGRSCLPRSLLGHWAGGNDSAIK